MCHPFRFAWRGPIVSAICLAIFLPLSVKAQPNAGSAQTPTANDSAIRIAAEVAGPGTPLKHFWSKVAGAGRANEGLRATYYCQPVGTHPRRTEVLLARARDIVERFPSSRPPQPAP